MFHVLARAGGVLLIGLTLLDVFLTVLYARIGTGIISHRLGGGTWRLFRAVAPLAGRHSEYVLSFAGPVMLVLLLAVWAAGLTAGTGLIIWPGLGSSIRAVSGPTPTDYGTAMSIGGDSLTTVGITDFSPRTVSMRLLLTLNSFVGMSVITLMVTYLLQIYNALQRRTTFTLKIHVATGETGDAVEFIKAIGPEGEFRTGYTHLTETAAEMTDFEEGHHFYPVLFYFRFREEHYATTRAALVCLDTVALIRSALDDETDMWLKESAAVAQLSRASRRLLEELAGSFLPRGLSERRVSPNAATLDRWRRRYRAALRRLQEEGIRTVADEKAGEELYVSLRSEWNHSIEVLARHLAHDMASIDPAGEKGSQ